MDMNHLFILEQRITQLETTLPGLRIAQRRPRIVTPETVIRWHRRGFRAYWRWKSRPSVGRLTEFNTGSSLAPKIPNDRPALPLATPL
jgi:hypothetical protein